MVWQVDREERRTFDPDSGLEIVSARRDKEETATSFRIEGPGRVLKFSASMTEAPITSEELEQLGLSDASVWTVLSFSPKEESSKEIIAPALTAFKWSCGYSPRGTETFVRFGRDGVIVNG